MSKFSNRVLQILEENHGNKLLDFLKSNELIKYIINKTKAAERGSKSRASYTNLYAIYVLVEDYINKVFDKTGDYSKYNGAKFSDLLKRQRELPFGSKLQNHGLNHRMNEEFKKFFPTSDHIPIIRDTNTNRYWINEALIKQKSGNTTVNLASSIMQIINEYVAIRQNAFNLFIETIERLKTINANDNAQVENFIIDLLKPNIDARVFEIVSYSILKYSYLNQSIYWGYELDDLTEENLKLYKTGRTNANDGGIDFVMKPLGRFFQVTETTDLKKYFLDIDKLERFPLTFVIKTEEPINELRDQIERKAKEIFHIESIVNKYMNCIEEIINIPILKEHLIKSEQRGNLKDVLNEILIQSKVEFNYDED